MTPIRFVMPRISGISDENGAHGLAELCHFDDQLIDFIFGTHVDAAGGFVHHKYRRVALQPLAENHLLLVSAGKSRDRVCRSHTLGVHDIDLIGRRFDHLVF